MIAVIFTIIVLALAVYTVWLIWEMRAETRRERVERARRMRVVHQAEYQIHSKASEAFRNMMRAAREHTGGCEGHR